MTIKHGKCYKPSDRRSTEGAARYTEDKASNFFKRCAFDAHHAASYTKNPPEYSGFLNLIYFDIKKNYP